jgi:hypothetical protein
MAEKSSLPSSVYAFDDEAANRKYQDAYNQLISAIDARQEKPAFDPTWLAAAQGFLAPKKTGSFFESLGNVAGNVAKAQEAEQNRALETAKARLDLAGMGVQQANQRAAMQMYQDGAAPALPSAPSSAPSAGAMEPSPSDFTLKSMGIEEPGTQLFPRQPLVPEKQFIASELLKGGNVPDAKIKYQDYLRKDIETTQNGLIIQRSTGRAFEMPDPTPASVPFLSLKGELFPTTKFFARKLDALTQANDNEGRIALENKIRGIGQRPPAPTGQPPLQVTPMPAATGIVNAPKVATITTPRPMETVPEAPVRSALQPAVPPAQMAGMRTPSEIEKAKQREAMLLRVEEERIKGEQKAQQERKEIRPTALEKQETEQEIKARQEIDDNRKEANDTIAYANQFRKYAELPNSKQMFGILNNQDLSSGLAKLVTETIRVGTTSIGMPAIEDVMRNANMNTKEQAQYRNFLQLSTQLQLQRAKYMKGSVSNYEQGILGNAGITAQDTPETIRMKADIMAARAQFDRQVAKRFKDSKQDAAAFLSSDEYINKMIPDYHDRLNRLIGGETRLQSKPPVQSKTPAQSSIVSRADALAGIR